jgi:hypothetical protein
MKHLARIEEITNPYKTSKWQRGKGGGRSKENTVMQIQKSRAPRFPGDYILQWRLLHF